MKRRKDKRKETIRNVYHFHRLRHISTALKKYKIEEENPCSPSVTELCIERMQIVRLSGETYYLNHQSRLDYSLLELYSCHFQPMEMRE